MANQSIKIPDAGQDPFKVRINNTEYSYPAGTIQSVPADVAALITENEKMQSKTEDEAGKMSYDDLKDKPYGEIESIETIIPEQKVYFDSTYYSAQLPNPSGLDFENGEEYILQCDGKEYVCTGAKEEGATYGSIGDSWRSEKPTTPVQIAPCAEDNDVFFYIQVNYPELAGATVTIGVYRKVKSIKKIDEKYLPDTEPITLYFNTDADDAPHLYYDVDNTKEVTKEELAELILSRRLVINPAAGISSYELNDWVITRKNDGSVKGAQIGFIAVDSGGTMTHYKAYYGTVIE